MLDLGLAGEASDELLELSSVLYIAGSEVPLRTLGVELSKANGSSLLVVEQASQAFDFELRTEYRLASQKDYVEVFTTATNRGREPAARVQLGDRARWPGTPIFAPELGHVHVATRANVPWLARIGKKQTHGFVFPAGSAQASFDFDSLGAVAELTLGESADVAKAGALKHARDAIVVRGGLGELAEIAWKRLGKTVGHARGRLIPAPAWATIDARRADGKIVLSVHAAADGRFELPLPPGDYRFVLRAPGGESEVLGTVPETGEPLSLSLVPPRVGTLSYVVTDEAGQPMPLRLVVQGVPPTKDPELVSVQGGTGAKNVLYTRSGSGAVELPEGRYNVFATRGPEYSLPRQQLDVQAKLSTPFRAQLARVVDTSGYVAGDFHVHADPSVDSDVSLPDRVLALAAEGIEFAAATDHNHVTDYGEAIRTQALGSLLGAAPGVEVTTPSWGHFNAFPYPPSTPVPPFENSTPAEMFRAIRARAPLAALQVNHPRMPGVGYFDRGELDTKTGIAKARDFSFAFDTLELVNGFDLEDPLVFERNLREWFELLNLGRRYTAVGNSDSHNLAYQWAGWPRTYVKLPDEHPASSSPADVARALTRGKAVVSCGIFVQFLANGSAGPGDSLPGASLSLAVSVRAPEWVDVSSAELYANGVRLEERKNSGAAPGQAWNFEIDLKLTVDTWLVVVARGEKFMNDALPGKWIRPFGFTNPIFVDANSDGKFSPPGR